MISERFDVIIVGAGHGGAQAAAALRQHQFKGTIAVIGDELDLPYDRPPLSKEYLSLEKPFDRLLLRPDHYWKERDVCMRLGQRVAKVDAERRCLQTDHGLTYEYTYLIWAAGGEPRRLSCKGADLKGIHTIRRRADVDRIREELEQVQRVVIIGGGYIGLEAAAVMRKLGKDVALVEAQDRVLARVAGVEISRFYENLHRSNGVSLYLKSGMQSFEGKEGRVSGVRLDNGTTLPADLVIVGIGLIPSVEPLLSAGAIGKNGVDVDTRCRTNLPNVFAIGDCAYHLNRFANGARVRLESVQNANDQATTAAREICGNGTDYDAVPWFWSTQYDLRLQTIGLSMGHDETVTRGDPADRSFSLLYLRKGTVIALDCVNAAADYAQGRSLVLAGASPSKEALSDKSIPLKTLAAC